jgi:hypothetical protein
MVAGPRARAGAARRRRAFALPNRGGPRWPGARGRDLTNGKLSTLARAGSGRRAAVERLWRARAVSSRRALPGQPSPQGARPRAGLARAGHGGQAAVASPRVRGRQLARAPPGRGPRAVGAPRGRGPQDRAPREPSNPGCLATLRPARQPDDAPDHSTAAPPRQRPRGTREPGLPGGRWVARQGGAT